MFCEFFKNEKDNIINYKSVEVEDVPEASLYLEETLKYIENVLNQKENILFIHCIEGKSRSASIIIGYLMKKKLCSYEEAFSFIKNKRFIQPNVGFIQQLYTFGDKKY